MNHLPPFTSDHYKHWAPLSDALRYIPLTKLGSGPRYGQRLRQAAELALRRARKTLEVMAACEVLLQKHHLLDPFTSLEMRLVPTTAAMQAVGFGLDHSRMNDQIDIVESHKAMLHHQAKMITTLRSGAVKVDLNSHKANRACIEYLGGYKLGIALPKGRKSDTDTLKLIYNSEKLNTRLQNNQPRCDDLKVSQGTTNTNVRWK